MAGDLTEARRGQVRKLWIKPDRHIAEILIEQGYGGETPRTAEGKRKQLSSMQRNVWNDRKWWREQWRTLKRATNEDSGESRGEYLATLESLQDVGVEILTDSSMRGTPRVQALMALTRIQEAKAKANGVAEIPPEKEGDALGDAAKPGLKLDLSKLPAAQREKILKQIEHDEPKAKPKKKAK